MAMYRGGGQPGYGGYGFGPENMVGNAAASFGGMMGGAMGQMGSMLGQNAQMQYQNDALQAPRYAGGDGAGGMSAYSDNPGNYMVRNSSGGMTPNMAYMRGLRYMMNSESVRRGQEQTSNLNYQRQQLNNVSPLLTGLFGGGQQSSQFGGFGSGFGGGASPYSAGGGFSTNFGMNVNPYSQSPYQPPAMRMS